jgi:hypothetical protein
MKKAKYGGEPFPAIVHATMEHDGREGDTPYPSFETCAVTEIVTHDYGTWIAKYRLVSVRKLRKKTTVAVIEAR